MTYSRMKPLPKIMVAPNGARRNKTDHPQLPITLDDIVSTAVDCWAAGAGGIHLHVRDEQGRHVLDAALYREAIEHLARAVPDMLVQITTEAVGLYSPQQQRDVVSEVMPESVSISIAEMWRDGDTSAVVDFYRWCDAADIAVQHILYNHEDLALLKHLLSLCPFRQPIQLLFVLGRYAKDQQSQVADLQVFTDWLAKAKAQEKLQADWAVCAFGTSETACLHAAHLLGAKLRVGFENALWNADGSLASSNAERVREISTLITTNRILTST